MSNCRSCGAEVIWCVSESSLADGEPKSMPVDAATNPQGNVEILVEETEHGQPIARVYAQAPMFKGGELHYSHFVTCPQADTWRKS